LSKHHLSPSLLSPPFRNTVFGQFGSIRQIRVGEVKGSTLGTAFVSYDDIYDDIYDAKRALEKLGGFNVGGRYLVVLYYQVGG
jgi:pre-mRNA branch site protein p14